MYRHLTVNCCQKYQQPSFYF